MGFKFYLSLMLFGCLHQLVRAQNDQYKFSHLDVTNGLSDNHINCIFKDSKGYMWFGATAGGLSRYDGYKFKIFKHDAKDSCSLGENYIAHIYEGPDNKLWIFTKNGIAYTILLPRNFHIIPPVLLPPTKYLPAR